MDDADRYSFHVLKSLERIEAKLEHIEEVNTKHITDDLVKFDEVHGKIISLEKDMKWHSKIASIIGTVAGSTISWLIGRHHG